MRILVTGSIAYDLLLGYDGSFRDAIEGADLESLSVSFFSPHFEKHHGGTGANISWNLRLLQQDPLLVGTVGHDGGEYLSLLEERGIQVKHIEVLPDHVTSTAIIGTDSQERQITFFHPGADAFGSFPDLADDREDISYGIVGARNARLMMEAGRFCEKYRINWLFDPGQQVIGLSSQELLSAVKGSQGVIVNAYEWSILSKAIGCSTDEFLKLNPLLIVSQGEDGLSIFTPTQTHVIRACKADQVMNPTGAGDALRAGILTGLALNWPIEKGARLGASLASFVVEQEGTLLDHLDLNDVLGRAEVTYGEMLPELL